MNIFEKNSYLEVVKESLVFFSEEELLHSVRKNLQFTYVSVSIKDFNEKYSARGWVGRKMIALPNAILGLLKTIYHLAQAVFKGFTKAIFDDGASFQAYCFYSGRDLQGLYGWIISLFNDRVGQYHIQESQFHQSCYGYFLANQGNPPPFPSADIGDLFSSDDLLFNSDLPFSSKKRSSGERISPSLVRKHSEEQDTIQSIGVHIEKGEYNTALQMIDKLHSMKAKESLLADIATMIRKSDREDVFRVIDTFSCNTKTKETLIAKIADDLFEAGDRESALKAIDEICHDTKAKESLIAQVAADFFKEGDRESALNVIDKICHDTKTKEALIAKIANSYYDEKNDEVVNL